MWDMLQEKNYSPPIHLGATFFFLQVGLTLTYGKLDRCLKVRKQEGKKVIPSLDGRASTYALLGKQWSMCSNDIEHL